MRVRLQFRFEDKETYCISEVVRLGAIIQRIPYLAKEYRPLTEDYRGYREGDTLKVTFLDQNQKEILNELWKEWGSLKLDDFRPMPQFADKKYVCYAKIEKVRK